MVAVGERVFDATHTMIATDPALIRQHVGPELQKLLREWPKGLDVPDFVWWRNGLRLVIIGPLRKGPETVEALVETGQRVKALLHR